MDDVCEALGHEPKPAWEECSWEARGDVFKPWLHVLRCRRCGHILDAVPAPTISTSSAHSAP